MGHQILLVLRGLPASGKSTFAREWVAENPTKRVRLNKDDMRAMLHNSHYSKGNEKLIISLENDMLITALHEGRDVVIDNTNLVDKDINRYKELLYEYDFDNVKLEIKSFDTPPEECIKRDLKRADSVGADVIWGMYWDHVAIIKVPERSVSKRDAIIVDVDGTLAQMKGRHPYEWDKVNTDTVRSHIKNLSNVYRRAGFDIVIVTGRDGICRQATIDWLVKNDIAFDELYSRAPKDTRKDFIVKREIYEEYIAPRYNILLVVDDRPQVIREWRRLGLPVINANPCDREF